MLRLLPVVGPSMAVGAVGPLEGVQTLGACQALATVGQRELQPELRLPMHVPPPAPSWAIAARSGTAGSWWAGARHHQYRVDEASLQHRLHSALDKQF